MYSTYKLCKGVSEVESEIIDERIGVRYKNINQQKNIYDYLLQNDLIKKYGIIWSEKRLKMFLMICGIFIAQTIIMVTISKVLLDSVNYYTQIVNLIIVFNSSIFAHEIAHIILYWQFDKKYNGYFKIDMGRYSFNYMQKSPQSTAIISAGGTYSRSNFGFGVIRNIHYKFIFKIWIVTISYNNVVANL